MRHAHHSVLALGLASSSAFLTASLPQPARACHPPSCDPVVVAPADGATVPANLPGFPIDDERGGYPDRPVREVTVELATAAGQALTLSRRALPGGGNLLVPGAPLQPGVHELRFVSKCSLAVFGPTPSPNVVRKVTIGPPQPLPTTAGQVTVTTALVKQYEVPASGSCSANREVSLARVVLQPSAELAPFMPLARLTTKIDGLQWAQSVWGGGERHPPNPYYMPEPKPLEIYTICENGRSWSGMDDGEHQGELIVEVPGAPALPPLPFKFRVDCKASPAAMPAPVVTPAPVTTPAPAPAPAPAPTPAPAPAPAPAGTTPMPPSLGNDVGEAGQGCAVGHGAPAPWACFGLLGLGLARLLRRGQRR